MAKILFLNVPAFGHVNPTLPVVTEVMRQGHHVISYNAESFAQVIQATGAEFRSYPNSRTSEANLASRVHNLVSVSVFLLEESIRLLPFLLEQIETEKPDLVIFGSISVLRQAVDKWSPTQPIANRQSDWVGLSKWQVAINRRLCSSFPG